MGEIWVRGASMMQGYLNNAHATEYMVDKQGFVHTGILGILMIKVAPVELEVLLLSHSEILNVVVIPNQYKYYGRFPNMEAGEVPIAFVVRSPNSLLTEDDVKKFIAEQVAPYKKIEASDICKQCAKSAAGKLLRRELIEKVRSET
ncbi:unnamed protein product [Lactuca saligna]|uniref:AMP-binding enzyme C-terminal domain-containing protein n=1 Tax=Lactuca saligna TaxID=75948 RepID=A0AA35ZCI5_LACSI|nr:unnamed protein product [Lactuca saligna]